MARRLLSEAGLTSRQSDRWSRRISHRLRLLTSGLMVLVLCRNPMILLPPILTGWHSGMIGSASQVLTQFAMHGWKTHCFWASALPFSATERRFQGFFTILAWTARCFCLMIQVRHAISLQVM